MKNENGTRSDHRGDLIRLGLAMAIIFLAATSFAKSMDCAKNNGELATLISQRSYQNLFRTDLPQYAVGKFSASSKEFFVYEADGQFIFVVEYFGIRKFPAKICLRDDGFLYSQVTIQGERNAIVVDPNLDANGHFTLKVVHGEGTHFSQLVGLYFSREPKQSNQAMLVRFETASKSQRKRLNER